MSTTSGPGPSTPPTTEPQVGGGRTGPGRSDLVGTGVLAVIGVGALIGGAHYGVWPDGAVGAGFLPAVLGGFVLVASVVDLVRLTAARRRPPAPVTGAEAIAVEAAHRSAEATAPEKDVFGRTESQRSRATLLIFVVIGVALALVPLVGLLLALTLLVFSLLFFLERKPLVAAVGGAVVSLAVAWSVFVLLLAIPLPRGLLDIL